MLSVLHELLKKTTSSCWERVRVRHLVQFTLFPVLPLKNTVLHPLFRETFSITLISSKWWWFIVTASLAMFRYLKIAHHTTVTNIKDYKKKPYFDSLYYISYRCPKTLRGFLWGNNSPISILASSSYLLCYEVFFLFFLPPQKITLQQMTIVFGVKQWVGRNCNLDIFKGRSNYTACCKKYKQILVWTVLNYFCKCITLESVLLS